MNEKKLHIKSRNARFRRWSRHSWAVFASLSAVVSIGFLSVSVGEKSLLKSETKLLSINLSKDENDGDKESETDTLENLNMFLSEVVISNKTTETAAVSSLLNIKFYLKPL